MCVWLPWGQQRWRTQTAVWSPRPRSHCPACLGAPGRLLLQPNAWRRLWCMAPPGTEMPACPLGEHRNRRLLNNSLITMSFDETGELNVRDYTSGSLGNRPSWQKAFHSTEVLIAKNSCQNFYLDFNSAPPFNRFFCGPTGGTCLNQCFYKERKKDISLRGHLSERVTHSH